MTSPEQIDQKLLRDKPTLISYAQAACFGWLIFGSGPAINFLREDLNLSRATASAHSLGMTLGGIIAGLTGQRLIRQFGRGKLLRWASIVFAIGLFLFCFGPNIYFTLLGVTLSFIGGVTIVQSTAAFLSTHHGQNAPAAISELHGVAAGIGLLSPVLVGLFVTFGFSWRLALAAGVLAVGVVEVFRGRDLDSYGTPKTTEANNIHHDVAGKLPKAFWLSCTAMICTSAVEYAMLLWSSDYLRTSGGFAKGASAIALGCIVGAMAVGRLLGSVLTKKWNAEKMYSASLLIALIGFVVFWSSTNSVLLVSALTITGLGIALHFPFGIERAIKVSAGRPDKATSRIAIATALSSGIAPFSIGILADHIGVRSAFLVVPVALVVAIIVVLRNPVVR